jgi:putative glutamine amidotransferase
MDFDALVQNEGRDLRRHLVAALGGDRDTAEDLAQETFVRAWQRMPHDLDGPRRRAWLRRTASNLAVDEWRRRRRRPAVALDDTGEIVAATAPGEPDAAVDALGRLAPHERFLLLLRFHGGLAHGEIARLLDITDEAARKRVARARAAFVGAYRTSRSGTSPVVLVLARDEPADRYVRWLREAGADARVLPGTATERDLALADGLLVTGATNDLHSELYGERPRALRGETNLERDRADLAALRGALSYDVPIVGFCRGHQLLNIASGGTLYQDVVLDGVTPSSHDDRSHQLETLAGSGARRVVGRSASVISSHHQAVRHLGRHLVATATSDDGLIESIERTDGRFALGVQWYPEADERGVALAQALVEAILPSAA